MSVTVFSADRTLIHSVNGSLDKLDKLFVRRLVRLMDTMGKKGMGPDIVLGKVRNLRRGTLRPHFGGCVDGPRSIAPKGPKDPNNDILGLRIVVL